jgi:hypothetical protein
VSAVRVLADPEAVPAPPPTDLAAQPSVPASSPSCGPGAAPEPARPPDAGLRRTVARRAAAAGLALTAAALLVVGVVAVIDLDPGAPSETRAPQPVAAAPVLPAAAPVRATVVDIPALKVHSDLVALGVDASGVLVPPDSPSVAGWFTGSAAPGDPGPSVIAGHVDSRAGPGIFFRLKDLEEGDLVSVGRSDGRTVTHRVTDVTVVPKDAFPTDQVYGPTPGPELRLITCGGEFDRSARRYLRNVVISAVLVDQ